MKTSELKKRYIEFFERKGHILIRNASLLPENDPTVLFTTAGMHPLVPYLLGEKHIQGKRLVSVQKCIRTGDIDEVGDKDHLTFFEMLGNWSLGDYWKREAIQWSYEFLIEELKLDKERIGVSCFKGDKDAEKDLEAFKVWEELGIEKEKIIFLGKEDNWWGPAGNSGPCGPDTEMFYYIGKKIPKKFDVKDKNWVEIWNDVFMQYNKDKNGNYKELKQRNVDTGMGVERTVAVINGLDSVYEIDVFKPIMDKINKLAKKDDIRSKRIIADHLRAACFILNEKIMPSNVEQGYVLRRLIRRAIRHGRLLEIRHRFCREVMEEVIKVYSNDYKFNERFIFGELEKEENRFDKSLNKGLRIFEKEIIDLKKNDSLSGKLVFDLYQSYGFPIEMTKELAKEKGFKINEGEFEKALREHQEKSRSAIRGKFKSGLADKSEETTKLHSACHLLLEALRRVLKDRGIMQKGSNITAERLRFDFNFPRKLTEEEIKKIEEDVNEQILKKLDVKMEEMKLEEAKKNIVGSFEHKYREKVKVYSIGVYSKEICAGPHVANTKELGKFRIIKEESSSSGVRRIKAVLE